MFYILLYVDPGSGSYLVQMIIAGVLGALFYFKSIWWKIKSFFGRNKRDDIPGNDNKENIND
jgi:ATP-dependent Zn protease